MNSALLGASTAIVLLAAAPASAGGPTISYVPDRLAQSKIHRAGNCRLMDYQPLAYGEVSKR